LTKFGTYLVLKKIWNASLLYLLQKAYTCIIYSQTLCQNGKDQSFSTGYASN
jgi:hypothetical protein